MASKSKPIALFNIETEARKYYPSLSVPENKNGVTVYTQCKVRSGSHKNMSGYSFRPSKH